MLHTTALCVFALVAHDNQLIPVQPLPTTNHYWLPITPASELPVLVFPRTIERLGRNNTGNSLTAACAQTLDDTGKAASSPFAALKLQAI